MEPLTIEMDHSAVDTTTEAFERLRVSLEAVNAALDKLADHKHGGITIKAVGALVHCEVKPVA